MGVGAAKRPRKGVEMRLRLLLVGGLVGALIFPGTAALAKAPSQAPSNDTIAGATPITSLPFSATEDTTKATTDSEDAALNRECGAPNTDASVWFSFAAASDASLFVDLSQTDYSAGVIVASGSPGNLTFVSCGPYGTIFDAVSGTQYYFLAFDDQNDGGVNGGQLAINVDVLPPPPEVTVTIDSIGHFDRQGNATVTGTETCTAEDLQFSEVDVNLTQSVGRVSTVQGFGVGDLICDGATHRWSALVSPYNGKFAGGKAIASADAVACNITTCTDAFVGNQPIQLRKG